MNAAPSRFGADELLDSLGQAVIATDPDGIIGYWNDAAERIYGWPSEDVIGRNIADVTVPQITREIAVDIMHALRDGVAWSGGFPVQRRDGSVFPALVTDSGIYRDGVLVGVVGVSANLGTALWPLLERSADAAIVLTTDAIVTFASPAVTPLFGWQPDDLIGKSVTKVLHPEDQDALYEFLHAAPDNRPGRVVGIRLLVGEEWIPAEAALTNLLDDPVVRGVICNLRFSVRLAQLQERERISQSLHADILQILFGASLELDAVAAGADEPQRPPLDSAASKIAEAIGKLRDMVREPDR